MLVSFSVSPVGGGSDDGSVTDAVASAVRVVRESGLEHRTDAMFTTMEGEWDQLFEVIKRASFAVLECSPRVSLVLKADIRPGFTSELTGKTKRLERAMSDSNDSTDSNDSNE